MIGRSPLGRSPRRIRVRALVRCSDIATSEIREPGTEWYMDSEPGEARRLMMQGVVEILDPQVNPGIVVDETFRVQPESTEVQKTWL